MTTTGHHDPVAQMNPITRRSESAALSSRGWKPAPDARQIVYRVQYQGAERPHPLLDIYASDAPLSGNQDEEYLGENFVGKLLTIVKSR